MPRKPPPAHATPERTALARGSALWRLHSDRFTPTAFNPTIPSALGGGRFDSIDGNYAYLYAAGDTVACVAETLLRDLSHTPYRLPAKRLEGLRLSKLRVEEPLELVMLSGSGLTAIGQDAWLSSCGPSDYPITREWAAAIRRWDVGAAGLTWRARHDNDRYAYVFFSDRCDSAAFEVDASYRVDRPGRGFSLVRRAASGHRVVVALPES